MKSMLFITPSAILNVVITLVILAVVMVLLTTIFSAIYQDREHNRNKLG